MDFILRGGRRKGGRKIRRPLKLWSPENPTLDGYVLFLTYVLMAVTGLGYLALMWSTVVLLGGFVTSLRRKDFWCLTTISMLQAARIFNEFAENRLSNFVILVRAFIRYGMAFLRPEIRAAIPQARWLTLPVGIFTKFVAVLFVMSTAPIWLMLLTMCSVPALLYGFGPIACIALAMWRILQRDYGSTEGDASKANLMPALDIFYSLVLLQGTLFYVWMIGDDEKIRILAEYRGDCKLPNEGWCGELVAKYLSELRARCWRDPASFRGRTTIEFAVDLLDSRSWGDNLSGARLLDAFIRRGEDVRHLLLPSRPLIQKMIDTLGWRHDWQDIREMRKVTARIVAHLAGDIHLAQFPRALRCIASLLQDETTRACWSINQQRRPPPQQSKLPPEKQDMLRQLGKKYLEIMEKMNKQDSDQPQQEGVDGSSGDSACNELILQGLTILESLASNHHNCRDICSTPGLLTKITAPVYSITLIQDIKIRSWADVVSRSFKVLRRLIRAPGKTGRRLRREISINKQAMSNLESILNQGNIAGQDLQMRAMEILTELALDSSINLTREVKQNLLNKQLFIFLEDKGDEAGRTLALLLSTDSEVNSDLIMTACNDIVGRLTEILDAKNTITYRTIAAEILENLCSHCDLNKQHAKGTLLPKVLTEILRSEREPPQSNNAALGNDEESQIISEPGNVDDVNHDISAQEGNTEWYGNKSSDKGNDEQTATKSTLQEALLSLTLVIYDKLITAADLDDVVRKKAIGHGAFVAKLKTIVQENCEVTVESLRIVKLCGQIAVSMMRRNHCTAHFKDQEFVKSLSESLKIMSNLESCMLFAGTDFGLKKRLRPLLSDIEEEARTKLLII